MPSNLCCFIIPTETIANKLEIFIFVYCSFFCSFCQQKKTENNETIVKKAAAVDNVASDAAKDAGATVESLIKHPLQNSWTLWYYDNEKDKSWELCQVIWSFTHLETSQRKKIQLSNNVVNFAASNHHVRHGGRFLVAVQSHQVADWDSKRKRLFAVQEQHSSDVGGWTKQKWWTLGYQFAEKFPP